MKIQWHVSLDQVKASISSDVRWDVLVAYPTTASAACSHPPVCPLPVGLRHLHTLELRLPFVDAGVADAVFAAQVTRRHPGGMFLQGLDDLPFGEPALAHHDK